MPNTLTDIIAYYPDTKTGEQANPLRPTNLYASKDNAQRAVDREWKQMQNSQP